MIEYEYEDALVCLASHIVCQSVARDEHNVLPHCPECGEETIGACLQCKAPIRGAYRNAKEWAPELRSIYRPASYCGKCGTPYPWTKAGIDAAVELLAESASSEERNAIRRNVEDVVRDTPRAEVAAVQLRRRLDQTGSATVIAIQNILEGIISSSIATILFEALKR